jgi:DNA polymerase-3 subunit delta
MLINLTEFYARLKNQVLKPIYLIASDVTLLQQEARDALRQAAIKAGYLERQSEVVEPHFDWDGFFFGMKNLSLFSTKLTIELYNPTAKFEEKAVKQLLNYLEHPAPDRILLVLTDKLTTSQQKTRWFQAIDKQGLTLNIRALTKAELPNWIMTRAKSLALTLDHSSILLLAELTEGNLLATQQALEKLQLLYPHEVIDNTKMLHAISDSARFTVFDLSNLILAGQTSAALRCLISLKNTAVDPTLILWAICREVRELSKLSHQHEAGIPLQQLLQQQWQTRRALLQVALKRITRQKLDEVLLLAEQTDLAIKGVGNPDPWVCLEKLILHCCEKAYA